MLIGINGGYFPAICRVCLEKLCRSYCHLEDITVNKQEGSSDDEDNLFRQKKAFDTVEHCIFLQKC